MAPKAVPKVGAAVSTFDTRVMAVGAAVEPALKPATIRSPFSQATADGAVPMNCGLVVTEVEVRSTVFSNLNCGPTSGGALMVKLPEPPTPVLEELHRPIWIR